MHRGCRKPADVTMTPSVLVLLLLLRTVAFAKPAEKSRLSQLEWAERQARFGDFSFLCQLLCESVEEESDEDDDGCWDYSFDGSLFCEGLCGSDPAITTKKPVTQALNKPSKNPPPMGVPSKSSPITPSKPTITSQAPLTLLPTTSVPFAPPALSVAPPTISPMNEPPISFQNPNVPPTAQQPSPTSSTPTETNVPSDTSSAPIVPLNAGLGEEAASDGPKEPSTDGVLEDTSEPTTEKSDDAEGSADTVDTVTAAPSEESEVLLTSSISQLDNYLAMESTTSQNNMFEPVTLSLKNKLMPYMPELMSIWCEFRKQFPTAETAEAVAKLCPMAVPYKDRVPSAFFDLLMGSSLPPV